VCSIVCHSVYWSFRVGGGDGSSNGSSSDSGEVIHSYGGGKSNPTEAELVVDLVEDLLAAGDVAAKDIAIISPYSKQVQLIRTELMDGSATRRRRHHHHHIQPNGATTTIQTDDIRVGTVNSFQGQETEIVIFSAVRSNREKELGFLRDPRRLNVAITRARRGLILLGDVCVLRTCRHWAALIASCEKRGCLVDVCNLRTVEGEVEEEMMDGVVDDGTQRLVSDVMEDDGGISSESMLDDLLSEYDDLFGDTSEYMPVEEAPKRK